MGWLIVAWSARCVLMHLASGHNSKPVSGVLQSDGVPWAKTTFHRIPFAATPTRPRGSPSPTFRRLAARVSSGWPTRLAKAPRNARTRWAQAGHTSSAISADCSNGSRTSEASWRHNRHEPRGTFLSPRTTSACGSPLARFAACDIISRLMMFDSGAGDT